jgi:preprotein translocase subunit YajC
MFDIAHFFVSAAMAQDAAPAAGAAQASGLSLATLQNFMPLLLIFAVFYVLIIRPQQKKIAEQDKMIKALKRGDRIITSSGIFGKITKLEDDTVTVEVADNVNIKMLRAQVQGLAAKTGTAAIANDSGDEEKKG